jgi:colicin import membrane protein
MRLRTADEPGRVASGALAVLVHLMFVGLLVFGISWQKKIASPVVVDLWQDLPEPSKKVALPPEPPKPAPKLLAPPPKPVPEVRKQAPPPPPVPKVETPKVSAADIELKEKLRKQKEEEAQQREELKKAEVERKEEQKRADAERKEEQKKAELEKRKLEEEQRKAADEQRREEAEQKRAEQEKLHKEDEARRAEEHKRAEEQKRVDEAKREDERKQRAAAAERERQQQEAVRKQREAEEGKRRAEAAARAAQQKAIDDWRARIQAKIKQRVVVPPNMEGNPEARFEVVLLPGGEVLSTTLKKPSGNPAYDAAVERAITAAQPLPVPPDTDLFQEHFRELNLVFRPKDKD